MPGRTLRDPRWVVNRIDGVGPVADELGRRQRRTDNTDRRYGHDKLHEFVRNERVRIVPQIKILEGGHRFRFTAQGEKTRVDHEH